MKNHIFALLVLLMTQSLSAEEFIGGVLQDKKDGTSLGLACSNVGENGQCTEIAVKVRYPGEQWTTLGTHVALDASDAAREARRDRDHRLNRVYGGTAVIGTMFGVLLFFSDSKVVDYVVAPLTVATGIVFDVVKAPLVGVVYVGHRAISWLGQLRMKKLIKFLVEPKNQGKTKKISQHKFENIMHGVDTY